MTSKKKTKFLALLLLLTLTLTSVLPPSVVYAKRGDTNADGEGNDDGKINGKDTYVFWSDNCTGLRVSLYWAPIANEADWKSKGISSKASDYDKLCANFLDPTKVIKIGKTADIMDKGIAPHKTVQFYSTQGVFQYMNPITIKNKKALEYKKIFSSSKKYTWTTYKGTPSSIKDVTAEGYVKWLTGLGLKADDEDRSYKNLVSIVKNACGADLTADMFRKGLRKDTTTGKLIEGVYKFYYEPTFSCALDKSGVWTQATFRDLLAYGVTYDLTTKLSNQRTLLAKVGDAATFAYDEVATGMTGVKKGYKLADSGSVLKDIKTGGAAYNSLGVSAIEPQRDNIPSPTVDVVKVVKSYVRFGLSDSDRELLAAMGKSGKPQKDIDAFLKNALGYKQIETVLETIPKSQLEIEVENTTRYVSEYGGTAYLNDIFTSGQDLTSTSEYKKDGYIDWTTELPTTGKTYFNVEPGVIWSYNLGMRTRAYYCS